MFVLYVVCKDQTEAKTIAKTLLDEDLIACANTWPTVSYYEWEGDFVEDSEIVLLMKTKKDNYHQIETRVLALHSYETPAIFGWEVDKVNPSYMEWLQAKCQKTE
ncbi:MAG: divalent-cation tolerance protein CutA [bacterium]